MLIMEKSYRPVIDLDGVLCKRKKEDQEYADLEPNRKVLEKTKEYKQKELILKKIENLSEGFKNFKNYSTFWNKNRTRKDLPDMHRVKVFKIVTYKLYKSKLGRLMLKYV